MAGAKEFPYIVQILVPPGGLGEQLEECSPFRGTEELLFTPAKADASAAGLFTLALCRSANRNRICGEIWRQDKPLITTRTFVVQRQREIGCAVPARGLDATDEPGPH
jgi:hypothetical protein